MVAKVSHLHFATNKLARPKEEEVDPSSFLGRLFKNQVQSLQVQLFMQSGEASPN